MMECSGMYVFYEFEFYLSKRKHSKYLNIYIYKYNCLSFCLILLLKTVLGLVVNILCVEGTKFLLVFSQWSSVHWDTG